MQGSVTGSLATVTRCARCCLALLRVQWAGSFLPTDAHLARLTSADSARSLFFSRWRGVRGLTLNMLERTLLVSSRLWVKVWNWSPRCGEYPFFRTQNKGLCSESVKECEKQLLQITRKWPQTENQGRQGVEKTVLQNKKMESFGGPLVKEVGTWIIIGQRSHEIRRYKNLDRTKRRAEARFERRI